MSPRRRPAALLSATRSTLPLLSLLTVLSPVLLLPLGPPAAAVAPARQAPAAPPREAPAASPVGFQWPLDGTPAVVRPFDPPPRPWLPGHRGVDLAAAAGSPVRAAGAGVVRFAGGVAGRGVVSVDHPGGLRTTYEPVVPAVRTGDRVNAGDLLGALAAGHPGCPVAACLHWGLRRGERYLDPLALLGRAQVRLLPTARGRRSPAGSRARMRLPVRRA